MNVEILVHGVPQGQDYFGVEEERTYVESFYDNSVEPVKFVVESKKTGNNTFVYYTYLRYKGIVGSGGRPGSYFGLTLRIDKYYQDVIHVYNMLEMVFKKYVVGVLLSSSGESYKYMSSSFASKKTEIEQLQQGLIQLIQGTCNWSKFVDIDSGFIHSVISSASCNIADITENAMSTALKKYSKVVLSPDYKLNVVKDFEKRVQDAEGKGGRIIAEKEKKLVEKDEEISLLKSTVTSQKAKLDALQTENMQLKKHGNLIQMISGIKDPINSLADYFRVQDSQKQPHNPSCGFKNNIWGIVGCVLSLIIVVLCFVALKRTPDGSNTNDNISTLTQQVESLTNENNLLKSEITEKEKTIFDLRAQITPNSGGQTEVPLSITPSQTTLKIDVEGYSKGTPLYCDTLYVIKVLYDNNKIYSGNGTWTITNATIKKGKATDSQITIQPSKVGKVKIRYESVNCICNPREFNSVKIEQKKGINFDIIVSPQVSEVEVGQEYTFSVSGYDGQGVWAVDGFEKPADHSASKISVKAIDKGSDKATVSYTPEGGKKQRKQFDYKKASE